MGETEILVGVHGTGVGQGKRQGNKPLVVQDPSIISRLYSAYAANRPTSLASSAAITSGKQSVVQSTRGM